MKREDAIRRVQALARLADRTNFPEEAESARAKAKLLMEQHQLKAVDFDKPAAVPRPAYPYRPPTPPPPRPATPATPPRVEDWPAAAWATVHTATTSNSTIERIVSVTINGVRFNFRVGS